MSYPALVEPADELTIDEVRRYSRHLIIPDVGMTGQKRLKNAKVLVIGAGGLGSPALLYLAAAGVRHARHRRVRRGRRVQPAAPDHPRSVRHREVQGGRRPRSRSPRPTPTSTWSCTRSASTTTTCCEVFEGYDLIVDGTDNFATRYMVNDAAYFLKIPYVWGSIYRFDGQASVFAPSMADDAPCYRCLYPEPPPPGMVPSCAEGGVLGVLCASIGSIQVNEAIKLLTGIGEPLVGKLMIYDALEMEYRKLQGPQGPQLRALRREPHRHRADRLRRLLRRDLRGGRRRRRRLDDLGHHARAHAQGARRRAPATSCSSTCASPTSTRSTRSPARC